MDADKVASRKTVVTGMREIKIRALRRKEKFVIDDEYLNGYARLCGWNATLVYMSICRHADKDQYSFPRIRKAAASRV
jgi:hypothetical protein